MNMHQTELLSLLKELDSLLEEPLKIVICGGAAGILSGAFSRGTMDIDLVFSSKKLDEIRDVLDSISQKKSLNKAWINDNAAAYAHVLPADYMDRIVLVNKEFVSLKAYRLSVGDLFFMKISALRPQDLEDLNFLDLSISDMPAIKSGLDKMRIQNPSQCLFVQSYLQQKGLI